MAENFHIDLNIGKEEFLRTLQEITYKREDLSPELHNLKEYERYKHPITSKVFVGNLDQDSGDLVLVAPKKFSHFTPLPYLLFWIDRKSPGTYLLAKSGYDLPDWFFSSTCTDMALAEEARNFCFRFEVQSNNDNEIVLFCTQTKMQNNSWNLLKSNLFYSLFPIAMIAILTDYAIFPFLATMSKIQIKLLIQVGFLLFFPYRHYLRFFSFLKILKSNAPVTDWDAALFMWVLSPVVFISSLIYKVPNRFIIIPDYSIVLISISIMYFIFFLLNSYTVHQLPWIIREIFIKQIKDMEASLKIREVH